MVRRAVDSIVFLDYLGRLLGDPGLIMMTRYLA